jgi:carboxymethylenebutenolidase
MSTRNALRAALVMSASVVALTAQTCGKSPGGSSSAPSKAATTSSAGGALPPSEKTAKAALETTPRHGEMIDVAYSGGPALRTWVSYPERKDKAGVVIVIHEIFGLSDWIRGVADRLAADGFIAVAPDLVSGMGPGGGGTDSVASRDDVVKLVRALSPAEARARIDAVRDWALKQPAANGKFGTVGYCWGGGKSFEYAASRPAPAASVVYYGVSPDSATLLEVAAPVQAHYGGDDARVDATIEPARVALAKLGRTYDPHVYEGAGHGFLRQQEDREGANLRASQQAWPQTIAFFRKYLE